ncbi:pif-2 [Hyphantria cunea granulovirus]|uniref:Pif-2 n=1 Tax=Hyphantria cunea granulovirus TaxID=307448 RepID=A0AAE6D0B5_9BBAC|nr:pif-2 [Hyphantria cunea granulovirus]QBQ01591.1 pif-2 [Hyphantria cunea granulovirus]
MLYWLLAFLFILLLFIMFQPLHNTVERMRKQVEDREMLMNDPNFRQQMANRRYAPLHTLPNVVINNTFDMVDDSSSCFSAPTLVTQTKKSTFDCASVCNHEDAAYFFVNTNDRFVVNGVRLAPGGYCTTSSIPRSCNTETSIILHSMNQWSCIAEDPRYFAGPANMVQVAGRQHSEQISGDQIIKNVLWDNLLNREVDINTNTFRRSWDETLVDGTRRFVVHCNGLDRRHNEMFVNPFNPIECLPNVCTNVNYAHRSVRPNFVDGVCECGDVNVTRMEHIIEGDRTSLCAGVLNRSRPATNSYDFRVPCIALDTPVSLFNPDHLMCPPEVFNQNTDFAYTFTLRGVTVMSGNGIDEPTWQLWMDTRTRINWNTR